MYITFIGRNCAGHLLKPPDLISMLKVFYSLGDLRPSIYSSPGSRLFELLQPVSKLIAGDA
jgi:hypothetical protein